MADPTPCPALDAAQQLAAEGHHVHYAAHGEAICLTRHCTPEKP